MTSYLQRCTNVASTLKVTSQCILNIVIAKSKQRWNHDFKFATSYRRWYYDLAPTLRQLCETRWILTIHGLMICDHELCVKVIKKTNDDMTFVWYDRSILWHHIQAIIFLLYYKSVKNKVAKCWYGACVFISCDLFWSFLCLSKLISSIVLEEEDFGHVLI